MPKPLKVPSHARSVPKPLKVLSLERSVPKPLKVVDFFLRFVRFSLRCGSPSICSRIFPSLRGPRREPTCCDGVVMDGRWVMDGLLVRIQSFFFLHTRVRIRTPAKVVVFRTPVCEFAQHHFRTPVCEFAEH